MKHRILVVEDNALNSELLRDWLEVEGYEVTVATDLNAAFAALRNQAPNAVLLDVQLGTEDGLSVASWMREQPVLSEVPVIAVTAQAMLSDQQRTRFFTETSYPEVGPSLAEAAIRCQRNPSVRSGSAFGRPRPGSQSD